MLDYYEVRMSELFDKERLQKFVKKASHGKNLGQGKLFDVNDPQQAEDMAIGLLTEYVATGKEGEFKKAKIAAGYITRSIDDKILGGMHNVLRHEEKIDQIGAGVASLTYSIAGIAARSLRDKLAAEALATKEPKEKVLGSNFLEQSTGDVIRGLFEAGVINPGQAAAILAYLRLETPRQENDQYQQLMKQVRSDLAMRLRTVEKNDAKLIQSRGMRIVDAYMRRRDEDAIMLTLPRQEDTVAVNEALVRLYMIKEDELFRTIPLQARNKYENSVAPIDGFGD